MLINLCKPVATVTSNSHLKQMLTTCSYSTSVSHKSYFISTC